MTSDKLDEALDERLTEGNKGVLEKHLHVVHNDQDDYYEPEIGRYHASASAQCLRRRYWSHMDPKGPDGTAYPHFEIGNRLEDLFEDALRTTFGKRKVHNGIYIKIPLGGYYIVGETDPVVMEENLDVHTLYEVKTTGNLDYTEDSPKTDHVYQVHCYMKALELDECKIVYINKYNLDTQTHVVEFDDEIWQDIEERTEKLHVALITEDPPDAQPDDERDYFCQYEDRCCEAIDDDD